MKPPYLSIVIPAFNEATRLPRTLARIREYVDARRLDAELLVIDDGSSDDTAGLASAQLAPLGPRGRVVRSPRNAGKGASVRRGMLAAVGTRVLFSDADLSTPIEEVEKLERQLDQDVDVAIGSRALDRSLVEERQPWARDAGGRLFNLLVRHCAIDGIHDTQCGFKLFDARVIHPIFARTRIDGFGFDVEVLALARRLGAVIAEVPVRWRNDLDSRVTLWQGARAFADPLRVSAALALGTYRLPTGARAPRLAPVRVLASGR